MKKSEMTCQNCINGNLVNGQVECRFLPNTNMKAPSDWCASGKWAGYIARYDEVALYFWGEWDEQDWHQMKVLTRVA